MATHALGARAQGIHGNACGEAVPCRSTHHAGTPRARASPSLRVVRVTDNHPVGVVGAGPHGLATVAHLRAAGVPVRVFGDPLSFWRDAMPVRMLLRSPIPASHISDPERRLRLHSWAAETNREVQVPLPVEDFLQYGLWFQERVAPDVDRRMVSDVRPSNGGFRVRLEDGESAEISRVVVAAGMAGFAHIPPELARLLPRFASHTSAER